MFVACYRTNKLSLCDFCTFVQINNNNNLLSKSSPEKYLLLMTFYLVKMFFLYMACNYHFSFHR